MPLRLARAGLAPRHLIAGLVIALCAAITLAAAAPASAITRKQASKKALAALGSTNGSDAVIVFGLTKPVSAGTIVGQEGKKKRLAKVGDERAFFYYEDSGPFQPYPHLGRVALVGVKSGKVKLSKGTTRRPLVNGKLPAFLTSSKRYRSSKYRVFSRESSPAGGSSGTTGTSAPFANDPFGPGAGFPVGGAAQPNSPPKAQAQTATVKQNSPKNLTLTATDDDGDLLTFEITKPPDHGTLSGNPPDVTYTPDQDYLGNDSFSFKANDGEPHTSNAAKVTLHVVPPGLRPTVTTSAGCTDYTEQTPAVVVDGQLTVVDPDDVTLDSARVRISANFVRGDDLLFTDQNGISGSYNDTTGELGLTGTSSVANYQTALRSVTYRNLAGISPSATKDIEFTANDAGGDSAPATKQICITEGGSGSNNRPIGETSEGALQYIENDGPVPVDPGFVALDADSADLTGATIQFTESLPPGEEEPGGGGEELSIGAFEFTTMASSFVPGEDVLAFTDQNGITGAFNTTTGQLTLSGTSSVANYEAAIRSVTYENTSEDPSAEPRGLRFQLTDSSGATSIPSNRGVLVEPVNDAPVVTTTEGTTEATGADPSVVIDSGVTTLDVDDDDLESARVSIASGFESGDVLVFTDQLGITGTYDSEAGILTLVGTAPVADYQTALRTVEFSNPGNPSGSREIDFVVNDGDLDSVTASKTVEVNDKPVLDTTDTALSYTENDGPVAVDSGITATDADSASLVGATVQITSNFSEGEDSLGFSDQNGITGVYESSSGTLTLSGSASVADYQTALQSVTYENSSENPSTATRTVSFQADDGGSSNNLSDVATRDIAVTAVNDAPVVTTTEGSASYTEGDPATAVDSGLTVADVDDTNLESAQVSISSGFQSGDDLVFVDQLGISGVYNTGTGVLTLTGTASVADYETALRSIEFRHTGDNPSASKTVEFVVNDGDLGSAAATKDIAVTGVNDAPVLDATDTALSYTEGDGSVAVDSGITATDVDSATLAGATVQITGNFQEGEDSLGFSDQNGITGVYESSSGTLTLSGSASVADYQTALQSVTYFNSSDSPVTATRTVSFQADDGGAVDNLSNTVTRDITVAASNDAPVVTTSGGTTSYTIGDTSGVDVDSGVTVTDADDTNIESAQVSISSGFELGDDLVYVNQLGIAGVYNTATGVLTLTGSASLADYETALRSIKFRTTASDPGPSRTVDFKVNDGDADSDVASKSISVAEPNEAPVVTTSSGNTTYTLGDTQGVAVDPNVTVSDANDANLEGAFIQIQGYEPGDELLWEDQNGISGAFNPETGDLALAGTALVADYQTALRSIKFRHTGDNQSLFRPIAFKVNDGEVDSAAAFKTIDLVPPA